MPTANGAWAPNGSANARMRLVIEYSTTQTASTLSVSGTVYVEAGYSFNDSSNSFTASGTLISAWSGAKSIDVASNGRQAIHTFSNSHARGSSSASKSMTFSLSGINYVGATASVSASVSIPAKPSPDVPGSVGITRVSLTRVRITWTGGVAHRFELRRRATAGSATAAWGAWSPWSQAERASGVEFDVTTGYEWSVRVARIEEGVQSGWGYPANAARLFDAPPAPTGVTSTYQSDAKQTTSWSFSDQAWARATTIEIQKWQQYTGTYGGSTVLAPSARSFISTASHSNDRLRFRVRAVNAAGGSAWVYGAYLSTTPSAPSGVSAARSGATDMVVSVTNQARSDAVTISILGASSSDGVSWTTPAAISGHTSIASGPIGNVISRTITGLDGTKRWRFYGRASVTEPAALTATSSASNIILLLQPPAAPKPTAPVSTQPAGSLVTFQWSHQPLDGSTQTVAEVRYRMDGGGWVTRTVTGASSAITSATAIDAGTLEWQARTKGSHADFGPWSGVTAVLVTERPTLEITSPADGADWPSNKLVVTLAYGDDSGAAITRYRRILRRVDDTVVEDTSVAVSGSPTIIVATYSTILGDGETYIAEVIATSGTGLTSSPATITVPVVYLPPGAPTLVAEWHGDDATVALSIGNVDPATGIAAAVANRIERSQDGQAWTSLVDGLGVDAVASDPMPPFRADLLYRAVAISALGAEAISDEVTVDTRTGDLWLTGENGATCRIELDLALQVSYGHTRVIEEYLGQPLAESHYGDGRPVQWRITGALLEGQGLEQDWRALLGQDCYLREPGGDAMWVSIQPDGVNHNSQWIKERSISLTVDAVMHE